MEPQKHPNRFIWTFGNHEPLVMYRRIGRKSTGGVPGSARWLEKWHHWYDSADCAETMKNLHLNILHCRCYKGLGWEAEKDDFANIISFARNCRERGIKHPIYIAKSSVRQSRFGYSTSYQVATSRSRVPCFKRSTSEQCCIFPFRTSGCGGNHECSFLQG